MMSRGNKEKTDKSNKVKLRKENLKKGNKQNRARLRKDKKLNNKINNNSKILVDLVRNQSSPMRTINPNNRTMTNWHLELKHTLLPS